MALNLKEVKGRIKAIHQTLSITDAMYTTSVSKLNQANNAYKKYLEFNQRFLVILKEMARQVDSNYEHENPEGEDYYLIITSNKGLCGSYHNDLYNSFYEKTKNMKNINVLVVGKKGFTALNNKKNINLINKEVILNRDDAVLTEYKQDLKTIQKLFSEKKVKNLYVVYNHSINALKREVVFEKILPVEFNFSKEEEKASDKYFYEQDPLLMFSELVGIHIEQKVFGAITDAKLAEHQSRMMAMKSASDNAKKVLEKLTILYNRARQDQITKELIDIVNGSQRR